MGTRGQAQALLAAVIALAGAQPARAECRLALALGFDVSRSVDASDYLIQRDGLVAALRDPEVRHAFLAPEGGVALALFEWSGAGQQSLVLTWTQVTSADDLDRIADDLTIHARSGDRLPTALGAALEFSHALLATAPPCPRQTLDLSGDGRNNEGRSPEAVFARRDFGDTVINALTIGGHEGDVMLYYRDRVIRGPGAFVEHADSHRDFPRAIRRKLLRELGEQVLGDASGQTGRTSLPRPTLNGSLAQRTGPAPTRPHSQ